MDIKDLSLFIGEQATGKSTVAKLIYFFKKVVKDELFNCIYEHLSIDLESPNVVPSQLVNEFELGIRKQFRELFFGNSSGSNFETIAYQYKQDTWVHFEWHDEYWINIFFTKFNPENRNPFNNEVYDRLEAISEIIIEYRRKYASKYWALSSPSASTEKEKKEKSNEIEKIINDFFGVDINAIYIPAGRSLLATLSDQLQGLNLDILMKEFSRRINRLKPAFNLSFNEIVKERSLNGNHLPVNERIEIAIQKIMEVLKGEYRVDRFGEKIYIDPENYVKLSMASSGQQESVWILLQLFILLLNREKVFLVIEEPEAHLFPKAQKSIVELITLVFKENDSQVLITTHSPYILTAFNNLIYAGNVGEHHPEVSEIIPEMLWLNHEKVGTYRLSGGIKEDLMDQETHLIRVEEIDAVSQSINQDFDAILNLELQ